jgi:hypothetical protein
MAHIFHAFRARPIERATQAFILFFLTTQSSSYAPMTKFLAASDSNDSGSPPDSSQPESAIVGAAVGGTAAFLLVLAGVGSLICFLRKRRSTADGVVSSTTRRVGDEHISFPSRPHLAESSASREYGDVGDVRQL